MKMMTLTFVDWLTDHISSTQETFFQNSEAVTYPQISTNIINTHKYMNTDNAVPCKSFLKHK